MKNQREELLSTFKSTFRKGGAKIDLYVYLYLAPPLLKVEKGGKRWIIILHYVICQ